MNIKCIIVDDEHPAIDQMEDYVNRVPFIQHLKSFDNAIEPIEFLKSNPVDLLFLDIEMEDFTGLQLIKTLNYKPKVILTTAYDQYAIDAFDLNVTDYLLKPISFERFLQSVDKVFQSMDVSTETQTPDYQYKVDYAFFKTEFRLQRIDFDTILFVEGMREYLRIHTTTDKVLVLMSFAEIEQVLPARRFLRVHKSYTVALDKIDSIERNRIYIGDKHIIPIGKSFKDTLFLMLKRNLV